MALDRFKISALPAADGVSAANLFVIVRDGDSEKATAEQVKNYIFANVPSAGISRANLANAAALSVIGRAANSVGVPADIAASGVDQVLRVSGAGALGFGQIATGGISDEAVTFVKVAASAIDTDGTGGSASTSKFFTSFAAKAYTDAAIAAYVAAQDVEVFKGSIDCSGNPNYPAASAGHVYRVSVAGKIGGVSGAVVQAGDRLECTVDSSASGNHATVGANWMISQVNIDGAVVGPASSVDSQVALFDGTSGKLIKAATLSQVLDLIGSAAQGDILFRSSSGWARLPAGTAGRVLQTQGAGVDPAWVAASVIAQTPPGHRFGCRISHNVSDADKDWDIATGAWRSDDDTENLVVASGITKRADAAWAVGSGNGGLDTGSLASNTWYYLYLIKRLDTGVVDAIFTATLGSPTMPTNYTKKRRIGAMKTDGSANFHRMFQYPYGRFLWKTAKPDVSATNPGTSAVSRALTVPPIPFVTALCRASISNNGGNTTIGVLSCLDMDDEAPSYNGLGLHMFGNSMAAAGGDNNAAGQFEIMTNGSGLIRSRLSASDANTSLYISTIGFTDPFDLSS